MHDEAPCLFILSDNCYNVIIRELYIARMTQDITCSSYLAESITCCNNTEDMTVANVSQKLMLGWTNGYQH